MIDLPQEIRILNVAAELIESMVNHLLCAFNKNDGGLVTEVKPKNLIGQKYFFVLLLEIFCEINKDLIPGKKGKEGVLEIIRRISEGPNLSNNTANVLRLKSRSQEFLDWLDHEFTYKLDSANLGKNVCVKISRKDVLYLVGNRCKHSLDPLCEA